jgi:hypothetical protein
LIERRILTELEAVIHPTLVLSDKEAIISSNIIERV